MADRQLEREIDDLIIRMQSLPMPILDPKKALEAFFPKLKGKIDFVDEMSEEARFWACGEILLALDQA